MPSSRYRAYYIAEALNELGHEAVIIPVSDYSRTAFFRYLRILLGLSRESVLYLQRPVLNTHFVLAVSVARFFGHHFIFDLDDAVYEHSFWQTALLARLADFVTCGSEKIREWAVRRNKNSFVLTNSIPLSIYTARASEPAGSPVIGWIGTSPHIYMQSAIPALQELAAQGRDFNVRVIGAMGNREIERLLKGIPNVTVIDSLNWADPAEAVREIKSFTIGIMPLRSEPWDQVKYFKALEYMACGVPVIASPGETVRTIITESGAGLVATNTEEWTQHISSLLSNPSLRKEMGEKGRRAIEREYSAEAITQRLLAYMQDYLGPNA